MFDKIAAKNSIYNKRLIFMVAAIYLVVVLTFGAMAYGIVASDVKRELGNKAMTLAIDITQWLELDEQEANRLLSLDFSSLLKDPVNRTFEEKARKIMGYSEIKYIYLEVLLDHIKYRVEAEEESLYKQPPGTPLNGVYLLDAVINEEARSLDTNKKGYVDKDRYTYLDHRHKAIYESQIPTYIISNDRWGKYITGFAPYYDKKGRYLGLVGVDLYLHRYQAYLKRNLIIIGGFVATLMLIGLYTLYLVIRVWKAEEQARIKSILSNTDTLTGLHNRRSFTGFLEHQWNQSLRDEMPISMMIIDVDFFKEYNDKYGHLSGDEALCQISQELGRRIKRSADFVGRYGGDEFIAVLHNTDGVHAKQVAQNIIKGVNNLHIQHEYSPICDHITVTIGIASVVPPKDMTKEAFIHFADKALYRAKELGRNQAVLWQPCNGAGTWE